MAAQTKTCKCHCGGCGQHFASQSAFDAHRVGKYGMPRHSMEGRRCLTPESDDRFVADSGECRLTSRETVSPALIWALAADRERLAGVFS